MANNTEYRNPRYRPSSGLHPATRKAYAYRGDDVDVDVDVDDDVTI